MVLMVDAFIKKVFGVVLFWVSAALFRLVLRVMCLLVESDIQNS